MPKAKAKTPSKTSPAAAAASTPALPTAAPAIPTTKATYEWVATLAPAQLPEALDHAKTIAQAVEFRWRNRG